MAKNSMKLDLSGFKEMLENIQKAGGKIEDAAEKALSESAQPFYEDLKEGIKKHRLTGLTEDSLQNPQNIVWEGNRVSLKVGFNMKTGGLPALFIEYGTPRQKAEPFIQPAIRKNQPKSRKIQQTTLHDILKELEK